MLRRGRAAARSWAGRSGAQGRAERGAARRGAPCSRHVPRTPWASAAPCPPPGPAGPLSWCCCCCWGASPSVPPWRRRKVTGGAGLQRRCRVWALVLRGASEGKSRLRPLRERGKKNGRERWENKPTAAIAQLWLPDSKLIFFWRGGEGGGGNKRE